MNLAQACHVQSRVTRKRESFDPLPFQVLKQELRGTVEAVGRQQRCLVSQNEPKQACADMAVE